MPVMADRWIRRMALDNAMIEPFTEAQKRDGVISYGLSSYGYDAGWPTSSRSSPTSTAPSSIRRISIRTASSTGVARWRSFRRTASRSPIRWNISAFPRDILVVCLGKSTYARCGIIVNVTPLEPEWEGQVTIEISNTTPLPARIYAGEGICQFLFLQGSEPCETSYADRAGKYMRQRGTSLPRM